MATAAKPAESDIGVRRAQCERRRTLRGTRCRARRNSRATSQQRFDQAERDWAYRLGQYELALNEHRSGTLGSEALAATRNRLFNERNCCASMLRCRCAVSSRNPGAVRRLPSELAVLQVGIHGIDTRTNGIADLILGCGHFLGFINTASIFSCGMAITPSRSPRIQSPVRTVTSPMVMGCSKASGRQRAANVGRAKEAGWNTGKRCSRMKSVSRQPPSTT